MSDITAELVYLANLASQIDALPLTRARQWAEQLSEAGTGKITFQNDDPALPDVVTGLPNSLINFYFRGVLALTMLIEAWDAVDVKQTEEQEEATIYSGRGHLALLDRAVIYPALGVGKRPIEEDRPFNWTAITFDDSGWAAATVVTDVGSAQSGTWDAGDPDSQWTADFDDTTASVLWAADGTPSSASVGDCYFRQAVTISADGTYQIAAAIDNYGEVYLDGALVLSPGQASDLISGFRTTSRITVELTAGAHLIAVKGTNGAGTGSNPAGIAWFIAPVDALGNLGAIAAHSDSSSLIVEYALDAPGMTPGAAILVALAEAQARGAIPYVSPSFDAVNDSGGNSWSVVGDISTKVGTTLLTFLRELSATYIDFYMAPGDTVLDCWILGGRGVVSGVDYHQPTDPTDATSGNLVAKRRHGEA